MAPPRTGLSTGRREAPPRTPWILAPHTAQKGVAGYRGSGAPFVAPAEGQGRAGFVRLRSFPPRAVGAGPGRQAESDDRRKVSPHWKRTTKSSVSIQGSSERDLEENRRRGGIGETDAKGHAGRDDKKTRDRLRATNSRAYRPRASNKRTDKHLDTSRENAYIKQRLPTAGAI